VKVKLNDRGITGKPEMISRVRYSITVIHILHLRSKNPLWVNY